MSASTVSRSQLERFLSATPLQSRQIDAILSGNPTLVEDQSQPLLLTFAEAMATCKISRSTLWRLIKRGALTPVSLTNDCRRLRRADVLRLIEASASGCVN